MARFSKIRQLLFIIAIKTHTGIRWIRQELLYSKVLDPLVVAVFVKMNN